MKTDNPTLIVRRLPVLQGYTKEFYDWCHQRELRFQRCQSCGAWRHPPRPMCGSCHSLQWEWAVDFAQQPGLVFEVVRRPNEIGTDPQVLANGYVAETDHSELGHAKRVAFPLHLNGAAAGGVDAAPVHGQHTEEILRSLVGLSWEELSALRAQGAI